MISSVKLVEQTKEKFDSREYNWNYEQLDLQLEKMLLLEWKIGFTKKTVSKNKLIKQLKTMHNSVDNIVYNSNKYFLFGWLSNKLDEKMEATINENVIYLLSNLKSV